jgi:hypothetical protein
MEETLTKIAAIALAGVIIGAWGVVACVMFKDDLINESYRYNSEWKIRRFSIR